LVIPLIRKMCSVICPSLREGPGNTSPGLSPYLS